MKCMSSMLAVGTLLMATPLNATPAGNAGATNAAMPDPNEKICEDIVQTGSRLATKRICATRAEWEERRKADREVTEGAQRNANPPCQAILTHSGAPNCG
jgi:hypothetical protein